MSNVMMHYVLWAYVFFLMYFGPMCSVCMIFFVVFLQRFGQDGGVN